MKKYLLFYLFFNLVICANAQTETYFIDWSFGSNPTASGDANSNRTIEEGDTVVWTWYANGTHNVASEPNAVESFDSGLQGPGSTFSYTFTQIGSNDYVCTPHSGSMFGTITVVPEGTLSNSEFLINENVNIYPNPADDIINLELKSNISKDLSLIIFNPLGQEVERIEVNVYKNKSIDISNLNSGLYFIKISHDKTSLTKRLIVK